MISTSTHHHHLLPTILRTTISAAEAFPDRGLIIVRNPKASDSEPPKNFSFDSVFAAAVEQKHIYDTCAAGVVDSVLNGYNGTIFAYGQVRFNCHLLQLGQFREQHTQR